MTSQTDIEAPARGRDWEPPYPANSARFADNVTRVVMCYLGVQSREPSDASDPIAALAGFLATSGGPDHVDRARFIDGDGEANEVLIGYWLDPTRYAAWCQASGFDSWWHAPERASGAVGLWREVLDIPIARLETIGPISRKYQYGIARAATNPGEPVPTHGYFGSMRDRLPVAATDTLMPDPPGALGAPLMLDSRGRRLRVRAPDNLALIRSGQDWTGCRDAERAMYVDKVHPLLEAGMAYLRDQPIESGCASCRFMTEATPMGEARTATFGLAYFVSLGHLEAWSKTHPSHLAIFRSFHELVRLTQASNKLKLWHEVSVVPAGGGVFEYVNCHARTGLLPWFPSEAIG